MRWALLVVVYVVGVVRAESVTVKMAMIEFRGGDKSCHHHQPPRVR